MEHIGEHLKAHAANDTDFRALISEPRMGKVCVQFEIIVVDIVTLVFYYCVLVSWLFIYSICLSFIVHYSLLIVHYSFFAFICNLCVI